MTITTCFIRTKVNDDAMSLLSDDFNSDDEMSVVSDLGYTKLAHRFHSSPIGNLINSAVSNDDDDAFDDENQVDALPANSLSLSNPASATTANEGGGTSGGHEDTGPPVSANNTDFYEQLSPYSSE